MSGIDVEPDSSVARTVLCLREGFSLYRAPLGVLLQQPLHESFAGPEVRLLKPAQGDGKICEIMLSGIGQNSKSPEDNQIPALRLTAALPIVHQEDIGGEFCGECNGLALSRTEDTSWRLEQLHRTLHVYASFSGLFDSHVRTRLGVRSWLPSVMTAGGTITRPSAGNT